MGTAGLYSVCRDCCVAPIALRVPGRCGTALAAPLPCSSPAAWGAVMVPSGLTGTVTSWHRRCGSCSVASVTAALVAPVTAFCSCFPLAAPKGDAGDCQAPGRGGGQLLLLPQLVEGGEIDEPLGAAALFRACAVRVEFPVSRPWVMTMLPLQDLPVPEVWSWDVLMRQGSVSELCFPSNPECMWASHVRKHLPTSPAWGHLGSRAGRCRKGPSLDGDLVAPRGAEPACGGQEVPAGCGTQ